MSPRALLPLVLLLAACPKKDLPEPTRPPAYEKADYRTEAPEWLGSGTRLGYQVRESKKVEFDLIVTVKDLEPDVELAWSKPERNATGTRRIPADDLASSRDVDTTIAPDEAQPRGTTSLLVSRAVFDDLVRTGEAKFAVDGNPRLLQYVGREPVAATVGGEERKLPAIRAVTPKGEDLWILANTSYPLILKADFGHELEIRTIRP